MGGLVYRCPRAAVVAVVGTLGAFGMCSQAAVAQRATLTSRTDMSPPGWTAHGGRRSPHWLPPAGKPPWHKRAWKRPCVVVYAPTALFPIEAGASRTESCGDRTSRSPSVQVLIVNSSGEGGGGGDASSGGGGSSGGSFFEDAAKDLGYFLAFLALAFVVASIPVLMWLHFQTRSRRLRDKPPASWITRPKLEVGKFDDSALKERLALPIAGLIRSRINQTKDRYGLHLVSGQTGLSTALDSLNDISSQVKAAMAIVKLLAAGLPTRRFTLTGELQPKGPEGPGISLALSRDGGIDHLYTFWAKPLGLPEIESASCYQQLAIAAAAWVDFRLADADREQLLTADPLSWVYFRSAVEAQRLGQERRATQLYEWALVMDGQNVGALANLGIVERRRNNFEEGEQLLGQAVRLIKSSGSPGEIEPCRNPDWYRIEYQLAALYVNWAAEPSADDRRDEHRLEAETKTRQLALRTSTMVKELGEEEDPHDKDSDGELLRFLTGTIEPAALVLLACTLTRSVAAFTLPPKRPERQEVLDKLAQAGAIVVGNVPEAERAPAVRRIVEVLIGFVELGDARPPGTLFDLACFYAELKEFDRAAERLESAVRKSEPSARKTLIEVAELDPTLGELFEHTSGLSAKLKRLVPRSGF
jgi:tetratricopeptide (TPR) repeat protein